MTVFAFYLFAISAITGGLFTVISRQPVHSVLWLILSFLSSAGLFVLLGAEFVAMLLIIVYVGAVAVLFLFVVMMLDVDFAELKAEMARYMPLALLIGLVILMQFVMAFGAWDSAQDAALANLAAVTADSGGPPQHRGAGCHPLRSILPSVPTGGPDPAGGHDRRHRADAAPPSGHQASGHFGTDDTAIPAKAMELKDVKPGQGL